jgi:hypothetical protein
MAKLNQKILSEAEEGLSADNKELLESKWGFLKNIVNIETFFSFGSKSDSKSSKAQKHSSIAQNKADKGSK